MELPLFINAGPLEWVLIFAVVVVSVIYVFGLIHCIANDGIPGVKRVLWAMLIFALPLVGTVAYWFLGRKQVYR